MHSLEGKNALLIGATNGIGLAVARNFVASGAQVTITGRRKDGARMEMELRAASASISSAVM